MNRGDRLVRRWLDALKPNGWQKFIYVSDDRIDNPLDSASKELENSPNRVLPLSTVRVGDRVRIVSLTCGESNSRLMGMGFVPSAVLEVVSHTLTGSVIVALQEQRLGLGAEIAQRIQVIHAQQPLEAPEQTLSARIATRQSSSTVKLRDAAIGLKLTVVGYEPTARDYKRKLLAMGLTPGTELSVKRHAPLGDPTEIEVRGFHLSLRKNEADALMVQPV